MRSFSRAEVIHSAHSFDFFAKLCQAALIFRARPRVQDLSGIAEINCASEWVQIASGCECGKIYGGYFLTRIAEQVSNVVQTLGILQVEIGAAERNRPVVAVLTENVCGENCGARTDHPIAPRSQGFYPCLTSPVTAIDSKGLLDLVVRDISVVRLGACLCPCNERSSLLPRHRELSEDFHRASEMVSGCYEFALSDSKFPFRVRDVSGEPEPILAPGDDLPASLNVRASVGGTASSNIQRCEFGKKVHFQQLGSRRLANLRSLTQQRFSTSQLAALAHHPR